VSEKAQELAKVCKVLDMRNLSELLLASREDLHKCKIKDNDVTEHTMNQVYAEAALSHGIEPKNAFELLMTEMHSVIHFNTGVEE